MRERWPDLVQLNLSADDERTKSHRRSDQEVDSDRADQKTKTDLQDPTYDCTTS